MRREFDMVLASARLFSIGMVSAVVIGSSVALAADPAPAKKAVDLAKGRATAAAVCAACHMPDGNSMIPQNPILAGQHAAYLEKQLQNFRLKPGAKEP